MIYLGLNEGCSWFTTDCINTSTDTSNYDQYFCDSAADGGCNHDYKAPAICQFNTYDSDLSIQWFDDPKQGGFTRLTDYCPIRGLTSYGSSYPYNYSICYDLRGEHNENDNFGEQFDFGM